MTGPAKICLCLLALISLAPSCLGQQQGAPPPPTEIPDGVRIAVRVKPDVVRVIPADTLIKTVGAAKVTYNYETMRKRAFVSLPKVANAPGDGIDMTAAFFYEGRSARPREGGAFKPLWFTVEFTVDGGVFGDASNRTLALESDGQQFDFGDAVEREPRPKDTARLVLKKSIAYELFVRTLGGGNVTIHLGTFSFELGEAERRAIRDLIKLTEEGPR